MGTVSCAVARAGIIGYRTNISGHQWTECQTARAGIAADQELRVGSEFASIITVDTWDPANNEINVMHGQSVTAKMDTDNSIEKEILYDEGQDFEDGGTLTQAIVVGDVVQLDTNTPFVDFDDPLYTVAAIDDVSQPHDWHRTDTKASANCYVSTYDIGGDASMKVRAYVYNSQIQARFDEQAAHRSGIVQAKFWIGNYASNPGFYLFFRTTGSGTGLRGHAIRVTKDSSNASFLRMNDWDSFYGVRSQALGFTLQDETWYWMKVQYYGTSNISCQFKVWEVGSAEPGSYLWGGSDTYYWDQDGYVGAGITTGATTAYVYWDEFSVVPSPSTYYSSGDWTSDPITVTDVVGYSGGLITWDETTPTNTTVAVKARWPNGSWLACTNNAMLPGITYKEKMVAGSGHDELELKIELATTDTSVTPSAENLRVYFEPLRIEEIELNVDSVACTLANELMSWWGRGWLAPATGGVPPTLEKDWDDVSASTKYPWYANDGETITVILKYLSQTVDTITFTAEETKFRMAYLRASWLAVDTPYVAGPNRFEYTTLKEWFPIGHDYYWIMLDKQQAMHADGYYIVGHYVLNDHIGSLLSALPVLNDHPGSMLVEGYALNNFLGHALVQGWKLDDQPGMVLPAVEYFNDMVGSTLIGVVEVHDHPGSFLLYGVNKDGAIFVNVIDDDTYQALIDMGITFS